MLLERLKTMTLNMLNNTNISNLILLTNVFAADL